VKAKGEEKKSPKGWTEGTRGEKSTGEMDGGGELWMQGIQASHDSRKGGRTVKKGKKLARQRFSRKRALQRGPRMFVFAGPESGKEVEGERLGKGIKIMDGHRKWRKRGMKTKTQRLGVFARRGK